MATATQYLTSEKYDELKKELEYLKTQRRKEVADQLEYSKKLGDLSENAEYHQARETQAEVEDRISRLENLLKSATIMTAAGGDAVAVGSTVRLSRDGEKKSYLYSIVGSEEADMAQGKVSNMSPLGAALLGHKIGDTVRVHTPKGVVVYKIEALK